MGLGSFLKKRAKRDFKVVTAITALSLFGPAAYQAYKKRQESRNRTTTQSQVSANQGQSQVSSNQPQRSFHEGMDTQSIQVAKDNEVRVQGCNLTTGAADTMSQIEMIDGKNNQLMSGIRGQDPECSKSDIAKQLANAPRSPVHRSTCPEYVDLKSELATKEREYYSSVMALKIEPNCQDLLAKIGEGRARAALPDANLNRASDRAPSSNQFGSQQ